MTFSNRIKFLIGEHPSSSASASKRSDDSERTATEQITVTNASKTRTKSQPSRKTSGINTSDGRPQPLQRIPSVQTRYMDMLLSQDTIPRLHNILASFFLAGYLVLPATFNSISQSNEVQTSSKGGNFAAKAALTVVKNVPLLYVGAFGAGVGLIGKACLFMVHRQNYIWLVNKIFMYEIFVSTFFSVDCKQARVYEFRCWTHLDRREHLLGSRWYHVDYCKSDTLRNRWINGNIFDLVCTLQLLGVEKGEKSP